MAVRPMKVWNAATSTWDDVAVSQRGDVVNKTDFAAKGDIIAGTGASAYDNVAVGSNGQMLMADSSATAGLRYVDPPANRNLLISGDFSVWARGTSFTNPGAAYVADRWRLDNNASAGTISRQAFTAGQTDVPGNPTYFLRAAIAAGATGFYRPVQRIEAPDAFSGRQVTLSFYAKTADTGVISQVYLSQDGFASGARTDTRIDGTGATGVVLTSSWQRFTMTGTFPSTSGKTLNASTYASVEFYMKEVANTSIDLANVQLEFGPVATPFEFEPYEATLRKCQRYYWRETAASAYSPFAQGISTTATNAQVIVNHPVPMRAAPTVAEYGSLVVSDIGSYNYAVSAISLSNAGILQSEVGFTNATGATANRTAFIRANNSTTAYLALGAEL